MEETRIDELYKNIFGYLDKLKKLDFSDRPVSEEIFKLYARDAEELGELLIEKGKRAGQIDNKMEQEIKKRLMKSLEIFKEPFN